MVLVRCNKCGWIGKDEQLGLNFRDDIEYCPNCKDYTGSALFVW